MKRLQALSPFFAANSAVVELGSVMTVNAQVTIRQAQSSDMKAVVDLIDFVLKKEFPTDQAAYTPADIEKLMETYAPPRSIFLVAVDGNQIVGTCGVKADQASTAILRRLFVSAPYRCKGIGSHLLKESIGFCRSHNFREIVIRTSTKMEKAIRLCQSLGFKEDGRWEMGETTLIQFCLRLA